MLRDLKVCFHLCDPQLVVVKSRLRSGGKPAADKLLKPVKANSKRGQFLMWFLLDGNCRVDQAMDQLGMTRNSILTYWAALNRDHGIGYTLADNEIEPILPAGCGEVFK